MAVDRTRLPALGPEPQFAFPEIRRRTLPNGLRVLTVEHREVPLISVLALVPSGAAADPPDRPGLAAITGSYTGTVVLEDKNPPQSYRLVVEGEGRGGFVKGSSAIALRPEGATTIVDVTGTVQTGGPIARVGQRLISGVAKMMMDKFFACLQSKV